LLGVPIGPFAKPVRANAAEPFFAEPPRNIIIYLAILGALGGSLMAAIAKCFLTALKG
jgi:hypothetical protein